MNKNKYLLLGSSVGVLLLLVVAAVQDQLVDWRRIQRGALSAKGSVNIRLRQIVNPGLGTSDRCVSCHIGMDPGEQGIGGVDVLAAHKPTVHDPAEFGCTICHSGQGFATEVADAHGEVRFWPEPMIPGRFSQAGCGTCHASIGIPNQETFDRARGAFERLDCLACHRLDGRGGTIRPSGLGMEGPDLSRAGISGYDRDWYEKHFRKSANAAGNPWTTSFSSIGEEDLRLLDVYMSTQIAAPMLTQGKVAFFSGGCLGCHKVSGVGGDEGPDLTRVGEKDPGQLAFAAVPGQHILANWFAEHFRSPAALVAGSLMPPVVTGDENIERLTLFTLSLRRRSLPGSYLPKDRIRIEKLGEREFASDGATVFGAICSGCHGKQGQGKRAPGQQIFPAISNPDFLEIASDGFLEETVIKGRPGRKMPAWGIKDGGLRPAEIREAVRHLRQTGETHYRPDPRPQRWISGDAVSGKKLFESACAGCHENNGKGKEGPALNNKIFLASATDTYLVETISRGRRRTSMNGFLTPSTSRPTLAPSEIEEIVAYIRSWEGEKK